MGFFGILIKSLTSKAASTSRKAYDEFMGLFSETNPKHEEVDCECMPIELHDMIEEVDGVYIGDIDLDDIDSNEEIIIERDNED